jgi:hypothetical protein
VAENGSMAMTVRRVGRCVLLGMMGLRLSVFEERERGRDERAEERGEEKGADHGSFSRCSVALVEVGLEIEGERERKGEEGISMQPHSFLYYPVVDFTFISISISTRRVMSWSLLMPRSSYVATKSALLQKKERKQGRKMSAVAEKPLLFSF